MNRKLVVYFDKLIESFNVRDRGDIDREDDLLAELDKLWLSMSPEDRDLSERVAALALAFHDGSVERLSVAFSRDMRLAIELLQWARPRSRMSSRSFVQSPIAIEDPSESVAPAMIYGEVEAKRRSMTMRVISTRGETSRPGLASWPSKKSASEHSVLMWGVT